MKHSVGPDVSQKETAVWWSARGQIIFEGKARSDPGDLTKLLRRHAPLGLISQALKEDHLLVR